MKNFFKSAITFVMALSLLFTTAMVASAAESHTLDTDTTASSSENTGVMPYYNDYLGHYQNVSTSWKTIATSTTGFNCDVFIECRNLDLAALDIRMLGKNGNVVWSESGAVGGQGNRIFWCGSDVYTIQVKYQSSSGSVYIQPW